MVNPIAQAVLARLAAARKEAVAAGERQPRNADMAIRSIAASNIIQLRASTPAEAIRKVEYAVENPHAPLGEIVAVGGRFYGRHGA